MGSHKPTSFCVLCSKGHDLDDCKDYLLADYFCNRRTLHQMPIQKVEENICNAVGTEESVSAHPIVLVGSNLKGEKSSLMPCSMPVVPDCLFSVISRPC